MHMKNVFWGATVPRENGASTAYHSYCVVSVWIAWK